MLLKTDVKIKGLHVFSVCGKSKVSCHIILAKIDGEDLKEVTYVRGSTQTMSIDLQETGTYGFFVELDNDLDP